MMKTHKIVILAVFLLASAGMVLFGCSGIGAETPPSGCTGEACTEDSSSSSDDGNPNGISSSSGGSTPTSSSSTGGSTPSSSSTATITSSSSTQVSGTTYQIRPRSNQSNGITHYWDACKPSCSWRNNANGNQARSCNISGANIGSNDTDASACDGGPAFTCMNQAPWTVFYSGPNAPSTNRISFGYVAVNAENCGTCYQLNFPNGEVMVVMKSNIGAIKDNAKFDLMVPGGGVGDYDALTRQIQNSGVSNPNMGERYGGFRGACGWSYSSTAATCVRNMCNAAFANLPDLRAGCNWYVDVLGTDDASWDNPVVHWQIVPCPSELTSRY